MQVTGARVLVATCLDDVLDMAEHGLGTVIQFDVI